MTVGAIAESGARERWVFLARPGPWFWTLVVLGLMARLYLATATFGTPDVTLWRNHARQVARHGLIAHYAYDPLFNHPPVIGLAMSRVDRLARALRVRFQTIYRLPIAIVDFANAWLILLVLRGSRWRYLACAAYCVAPVALVLGAEHGNTDTLVAACLLGATLLVARRRPVLAGLLIGALASIKIPGLFAAPALGFALPRWRDRIVCALVAVAIAAPPYAWAVYQGARFAATETEAGLSGGKFVLERVFMYRGYLMTAKGDPPVWIWGLKNFAKPFLGDESDDWPEWAQWWLGHSHVVALPLMFLFGFLRRRERSAPGIAATIAGTYAIFYGLVETWATQYFAWSMPFWMLAGWPFAAASNLLGGGYIYAYYVYRTNDWALRPRWATTRLADWPEILTVMRDLAVLAFLAFAAYWFARAVRDEVRAWRRRRFARAEEG